MSVEAPGTARDASSSLGRTHLSGRRRRPSGEPPPLPRQLRASGKFWLVMLAAAFVVGVLVTVFRWAPLFLEHADLWITDRVVAIRTPWLTHLARGINALGSSPVDLTLRWVTIFMRFAVLASCAIYLLPAK